MYSYIKSIGNDIFVSAYDEQGRRQYIHDRGFKPYFFVSSKKKTGFRRFPEGYNVGKVAFESINDLKYNKDSYPQDVCHGKIKDLELVQKIRDEKLYEGYDPQHLKVMFYDIEVHSEKGFPHADKAEHPVVSISSVTRGSDGACIWYLSSSFEYSRIDWFHTHYPEMKKYTDVETIERIAPKFAEKSIEAIDGAIEKLKKKKQEMIEEFNNDEILQEEHYLVNYYIQPVESKIDSLLAERKRFTRIEKNIKRMKLLDIRRFITEEELLDDFFSYIRDESFDVVTGWNSGYFDHPYLMNRGVALLGLDKMKTYSPFNTVEKIQIKNQDKSVMNIIEPVGFNFVDYMRLDKNYRQNKRDSYKLENVSQDEVGFGKVDYEGSLQELWINDKQKYLTYNIGDSECLEALDEKLGYINLLYSICHYARCSQDSFANASYIWEAKLYNELMDVNLVIPSSGSAKSSGKTITGAFVKEPIMGFKDWVMSVDLTSLYPSNIRMCNMSHEMILRKESFHALDEIIAGTFDFTKYKQKNECFTPFGLVFSKKRKGFITEIIEKLFVERKQNKKKSKEYERMAQSETDPSKKVEYKRLSGIYNGIQGAQKVLLNSYYGALQVGSFALHNRDYAEAITTIGQVANRYCERELNIWLNQTLKTSGVDYIVAGDTDSLYIDVSAFVERIPNFRNLNDAEIVQYLDTVGKQLIEPKLAEIYEKMTDYMGVFENTMNMDREAIAKGAFWKAKKRYAMHVYDMEGTRYETPKQKIMGIQIVRSDTPTKVKPILKDFISRLLYDIPVNRYITEQKNNILEWKPCEMAKPMSVSVYDDYYEDKLGGLDAYKKGAPYTVKGAIRYNRLLKRLGLEDKYPVIRNSDKILFVYLKPNNMWNIDGIAFPELIDLPEEFKLHDDIDKQKQYYTIAGKFFEDMLEIVGKASVMNGYNNDLF